ncbi:MAG: hypothetical protein K2H13_08560 [Eubacterium sp.]|nr:hypothetical protein [Eubacterium sp.]
MIRILFIDDTHARPRSIIGFLEEKGVYTDSTIVATQRDAYIELENKQYDLVVIDIKLPKSMSTYTTEDYAGIDILNSINYQENINKPLFIIGVTSEKSIYDNVKSSFEDLLFPIFFWNEFNDDNKLQLLRKIKYLEDLNSKYKPININKVDVAIITAVDDEYKALDILSIKWENTYLDNDPGIYSIGELKDNLGNIKRILKTKLPEMGMASSAFVTTQILNTFEPEAVIMVGICGGREGEVNLGDIIVADRTWDYGSGKIKYNKNKIDFHALPNQISLDPLIKSNIERNSEIVNEIYIDWNKKNNDNKISSMKLGALPSGSAVVATEKFINTFVEPQYRKYIGIDMETYGVYFSCKNHRSNVKYVSIKSVSDLANHEKDDTYHKYCSYVSAKYAFKLIEKNII